VKFAGQFGHDLAHLFAFSKDTVVGCANGDGAVVVALGAALYDHAVNEQGFEDVEDGRFVATTDVAAGGEGGANLAGQFAVEGDGVVDEFFQIGRHGAVIGGRAHDDGVIVEQVFGGQISNGQALDVGIADISSGVGDDLSHLLGVTGATIIGDEDPGHVWNSCVAGTFCGHRRKGSFYLEYTAWDV